MQREHVDQFVTALGSVSVPATPKFSGDTRIALLGYTAASWPPIIEHKLRVIIVEDEESARTHLASLIDTTIPAWNWLALPPRTYAEGISQASNCRTM